ncbi:hypothetical protein TNCV_2390881 [Trichonephila clavipes]|nr:hypothetical protein TNCV_2390881 [Trichonephila clavipes]
MRGYFECPCPSIQEHVGCHSRLNRDSSVNSTLANHVAPSLDVQQPIFFLRAARGRGVNGMQTIGLRAWILPQRSRLRTVWLDTPLLLPRATVFAAA